MREDFSAFWEQSMRDCRSRPFNDERTAVDTLLLHTEAYHVSFEGYDHTQIKGWYLVPNRTDQEQKLPCIVIFHGYPGYKGNMENYASWLLMGMSVLAIDVRGQHGESGNLLQQTNGITKGWYSQGILDKDQSYYKAILLDAVRAIDWAAQPEVDPSRIVITGTSQGGGIALIATALYGPVAATVAHIPSMCWMDYGVMHSTGSLSEIGQYASIYPDQLERILETLSYFDVLHLADRIHNPLLVSVGLKDTVCWPETIFAAYNRIASEHKEILIDPFVGHHVSGAFNHKGMEFIARWIK
jgi:cephalosporin-C deacetylase